MGWIQWGRCYSREIADGHNIPYKCCYGQWLLGYNIIKLLYIQSTYVTRFVKIDQNHTGTILLLNIKA